MTLPPGIRLKPLVWDANGNADVYSVRFSNGQGAKAFMVSRGSKIIAWCDDPEEAKAAAQADYAARIAAMLEPDPEAGAVKRAIKQALDIAEEPDSDMPRYRFEEWQKRMFAAIEAIEDAAMRQKAGTE